MKLFHWNQAKSLMNYSTGDIIVMAENLESARLKARIAFNSFIREHCSWWFLDGNSTPDPDSWEDYDKFLKEFEADLAKTPDEKCVVFILGSE